MVYGCDGPWWDNKRGLPDFAGTKLAHDTGVCARYPDVHKIEVRDHDKMLFDEPGVIGSGGNSGFQALNLAAQFGATQILLIGFDMHTGNGLHWYGPNRWHGANNPGDPNLVRWRNAFAAQASKLNSMGIEVVNASQDSALRCFEIAALEDVLRAWGL